MVVRAYISHDGKTCPSSNWSLFFVLKVELKMKSQLFYTAHQLVEAGPKQAVSWFAVGCYYHLLEKNELAQRYFLKVGVVKNSTVFGVVDAVVIVCDGTGVAAGVVDSIYCV